jgi:DMSO/TMAO reductase YedYZ molybdopterin-dependent catalytic subunit
MITAQLDARKGAKWINRIEGLNEKKPGFWELGASSGTAHPWRDDRYACVAPRKARSRSTSSSKARRNAASRGGLPDT